MSLIIEKSSPLNYNLGALSPVIWIGEEICSDTQNSLPYSVIAETDIKVLRIDRSKMRELLPREFQDKVQHLQDRKSSWFESKVEEIESGHSHKRENSPRKFYYPAKTTFANKFLNLSDSYHHKIDGQFPKGRPILALH